MKNTTKKGRRWIYLLFFTIGILSLPLSIFLGGLLASADLIHLDGPSELLFALLICSILFTLGLYAYNKELSFIFVLKLFIISIVTSFSIFYVSLFLGLLPPLFPLLILLILFVIGLIAFNEYPLINFALKAFAISFIALFLIFGGFLMWSAQEHTGAISIEKFDTLEEILKKYRPPEKVEYVEITEEELKEYPALAKAISGEGCKKLNEDSWELEVHLDESMRTFEFIEGKCKDVPFINGPFIKIGEKYYEVSLGTVTGPGVPDSKEVIYIKKFDTPEEILEEYRPHIKAEPIEITEEELEEYPALKKAISGEGFKKYNEDRWSLKVHPEEWKRTRVFIGEKGSNVIKVGEVYYEVGFVTA